MTNEYNALCQAFKDSLAHLPREERILALRAAMKELKAFRDRNGITSSVTNGAVSKTSRKTTKADLKFTDQMGPKRSLNAWMGFRCYHLCRLAGLPQKVISKILTIFWRHDLFGAKWTLLAKAYSIVRGSRAKKDAPLTEFFAICAPLVGVVPPAEYMRLNGWKLGPPEAGSQDGMPTLTRTFTPTIADFSSHFATTNLSVDDLVRHCYTVGYVTVTNQDGPSLSTQGSLNMVSMPTVSPAPPTPATMPTATSAPAAPSPAAMPSAAATSAPSSTDALPNDSTVQDLEQTLPEEISTSPIEPAADGTLTLLPRWPNAAQNTLARASELLAASGSIYPHYDMFAPDSEFISFNPAADDPEVVDGGRFDPIDFDAFIYQ